MKKCLAVIAVFLLIVAAGGYFARQYLVRTPVYKMYKVYSVVRDVDKTADDLQLTAAQRRILSDIRRMIAKEGEKLNDGGGDIIEQFLREFQGDRFNQPKMNSLVGKLLRRIQGIMPDLFEKVGEFHASLTPGQKSKVVELLGGIE